jgi:large subunit ribosomal protein L1
MAEAKKKKSKKTIEEAVEVTETVDTTVGTSTETTADVAEEKVETPVATAKAGKRSTKTLAEIEEKEAKEARKAAAKAEGANDDKPKQPIKPARSRLERRGKKFREVAKLIEVDKQYTIPEALELATKTSPVKFDATVELHIRLGVDPRQADQNIRDNLVLPAGTGKKVRVAVFADEDVAKTALKAGADVAGDDDFLAQLDKGTIDFDVLIATPSVMARLSKYARVLGPKGLMPNPKSGTVTTDVEKAVTQAKAGRVEYRVDSTGIVHIGVGKVSFGPAKLNENVAAVVASIKGNKPSSIKGNYVRSFSVTTSMGPGIKVFTSEIA